MDPALGDLARRVGLLRNDSIPEFIAVMQARKEGREPTQEQEAALTDLLSRTWERWCALGEEERDAAVPADGNASLALLKACKTGDRTAARAALDRGAELGWSHPNPEPVSPSAF